MPKIGFNDRFIEDENGSYSIEAVIWLPIFVFLISLIINISAIYYDKSQIARIVQDANRAYSVGAYMTDAETEASILTSLQKYSTNATVDTFVSGREIETRVVIPAIDMIGMNIFPVLRSINVNIAYKHFKEW